MYVTIFSYYFFYQKYLLTQELKEAHTMRQLRKSTCRLGPPPPFFRRRWASSHLISLLLHRRPSWKMAAILHFQVANNFFWKYGLSGTFTPNLVFVSSFERFFQNLHLIRLTMRITLCINCNLQLYSTVTYTHWYHCSVKRPLAFGDSSQNAVLWLSLKRRSVK